MKKRITDKQKVFLTGLTFIFITLIALLIRFNNYEESLNFHMDPPLFLHEVKDMVEQRKLRLIGPMVSSKTVEGRVIFTGPIFYYLLAVLGIVFNWKIVYMTGFFAFWWVVTFALIFWWLRQRFGNLVALIIYALISFFHWLLPYSRIIWNPDLIPFFGVLFFWLLDKRENKRLYYLLAGLVFGLGLSVHYAVILLGLVVFYYLWTETKRKAFSANNWWLFLSGLIVANFPLILFELRHNFYNLKTLLFHLQNYQPSESYSFNFRSQYYYYIFPFIPLGCKAYGIILEKIKKAFDFKVFITSQVILITLFLTYSLFGPTREALINPEGWTIAKQKEVTDLIVDDNEKIFEVATTIGPDTRASELRWWLRQKDHPPMSVIDYESATVLYLVAPRSRPPETETVWEVKSLKPFTVEKRVILDGNLVFYKLVRKPPSP